ncbi:MAG: flagellar motor switch protein FliG [Gammaproteobacteria bacterium]
MPRTSLKSGLAKVADRDDTANRPPLDSLTRAAVFAQIIGEEAAAKILEHLNQREIQRLVLAIQELGAVPQPDIVSTVDLFAESVGLASNLGMDADLYIRDILVRAHGEDKATGLMDRLNVGSEKQGLENLKWLDARQVVEIIRDEHPQIKALVLSYLEPDHAAEVLGRLPNSVRPDILLRIATLETVQPAAFKELNASLEAQLSGSRNVQATVVGGIKAAANILNYVDSANEAEIMELVKEQDDDIGEQIEGLMFVFDNLIEVEAVGIQTLLREVASDGLLLALKGADESLRDHFFANMSKRAGEMMRDDLEAKGPVRLSEVEAAQKEILTIARRLSDDGQISLGGQGGEEYV